MGIYDAQLQYSAAQALTATAVSTNIIDHTVDGNLGIGNPMVVVVFVDVALDATTGDETYTFKLETDDNSGFSSATQVGGTVTMTRGAAAGTRYVLSVPPDTTMERYSRLTYTLGGTTPTGTVTAFLTPQDSLDNMAYYSRGYSVS